MFEKLAILLLAGLVAYYSLPITPAPKPPNVDWTNATTVWHSVID